MILESLASDKERVSWQDDEGSSLESRLAEIAIQLILTAELQRRESAIRRYQWPLERKAQLEEEERERKHKAERAEREGGNVSTGHGSNACLRLLQHFSKREQ